MIMSLESGKKKNKRILFYRYYSMFRLYKRIETSSGRKSLCKVLGIRLSGADFSLNTTTRAENVDPVELSKSYII